MNRIKELIIVNCIIKTLEMEAEKLRSSGLTTCANNVSDDIRTLRESDAYDPDMPINRT